MYFGAAYYPEHWGEERWEFDLKKMKSLHFNMVRIAEFAWCRIEPEDGVYDFTWLDNFLDLCRKYDFKVMMGLPYRVVPAWLFKKDPEMAILSYDGHRETFGTRYTTCLSNKTLRKYAIDLTRKIVNRYKDDDCVVAWHLDNEYGDASICYCENCRQEFINWLKQKYRTLDNLNKTWGLVFWSMELTDWDQVWVPSKSNHFQKHPSLLQDYYRFNSWKTEKTIREQAEVVRSIAPSKIITTNFQSSTRDHTDYYKASQPLGVVSMNYYPPDTYNTVDLDIIRGLKNQNFWVVEQKSGSPGSQTNSYYTSPPGEIRMYTYQSIGHGADLILYYRYRPSYFGNEQFYMGIMNYDGSDNRISKEIARIGEELPIIAGELKGTKVINDTALLYSYDSRWADKFFKPNPDINYRDVFLSYYNELERQHIGMDIISPYADLSSYKVVVIPYLYLTDEAIVENITKYVEQGGTIIASARLSAKDEYARMTPTHIHPKIAKVLGINVEEVLSLKPDYKNAIELADGTKYTISLWAELLVPTTAKILARYCSDWYKGYAAVTYNQFGRGQAYYIGTMPEGQFYTHYVANLVRMAGVQPLVSGSPDVQACERCSDTHRYTFLLNTSDANSFVSIDEAGIDILTGKEVSGTVELKPYDVMIIKRPK
ncbi:MAG: beta-galactosidase [Bacillota bacterium]